MPERGIDCTGFAACCRTSSFAMPFNLGGPSGWCRYPVEAISRPLAMGIWLESIHIYSPDDWND